MPPACNVKNGRWSWGIYSQRGGK